MPGPAPFVLLCAAQNSGRGGAGSTRARVGVTGSIGATGLAAVRRRLRRDEDPAGGTADRLDALRRRFLGPVARGGALDPVAQALPVLAVEPPDMAEGVPHTEQDGGKKQELRQAESQHTASSTGPRGRGQAKSSQCVRAGPGCLIRY